MRYINPRLTLTLTLLANNNYSSKWLRFQIIAWTRHCLTDLGLLIDCEKASVSTLPTLDTSLVIIIIIYNNEFHRDASLKENFRADDDAQ